jgi:hypothetical protein
MLVHMNILLVPGRPFLAFGLWGVLVLFGLVF